MNEAMGKLKPLLLMRDGKKIKRIKQAETAVALLGLVSEATGLAESVWQERIRQLDTEEIVPLLAQRLKTTRQIQDRDKRGMASEKLISGLRWHGDAAAAALLDCFTELTDYGQSLACVVLGLLGAAAGADKIWRFYKKAVGNRRETYFIGALWGLIDLEDGRAGKALVDLLRQGRDFYELFGFLSLAGDAQAVLPLVNLMAKSTDEDRRGKIMALISIGHRIGRDALIAEFEKAAPPDVPAAESKQEIEAAADRILSQPAHVAEEYFALFYRHLTPEDITSVF